MVIAARGDGEGLVQMADVADGQSRKRILFGTSSPKVLESIREPNFNFLKAVKKAKFSPRQQAEFYYNFPTSISPLPILPPK